MQKLSILQEPIQPQIENYRLICSGQSIPVAVIRILENCHARQSSDAFVLDVPKMSADDYKSFKQVVHALKGRWDGKTHSFAYDPSEFIQQVAAAGRLPKANPYDLFETPDETVDDLLNFIGLPEQQCLDTPIALDLLEPSAGTGQIARRLRQRLPSSCIDVAEIDPFNQQILQSQGFNLICVDWLKFPKPGKQYDYILTNPPFHRGDYITHIRQDYDFLKLGGSIGAIVPESMLRLSSIKKIREFRNWVAEFGYWEFIGSPFKGTKTSCLMLEIRKLNERQTSEQWQPVNGYASRFHESIQLALDCNEAWSNALSQARNCPNPTLLSFFGRSLDSVVGQMIEKEYCCFLYNERVKQQLIEHALKNYQND